MDATWQLLSRIVQHDTAYAEAVARAVSAEMFGDVQQRKVFEFLTRFREKYQKCPSAHLLGRKFPQAHLNLTVEEPTPYYIDEFLKQYLRADGAKLLLRTAESLADDPLTVLREFGEQAARLAGLGVPSDNILDSRLWRRRRDYYKQRASGEILGIPTPFETWNDMTLGWRPEDYVILTARPSVGKTFMLLFCMIHARRQNKKCLFITKEMSIDTLQMREDALMYGLPYKAFRAGQLSEGQYKAWVRGMKEDARLVREGQLGEAIFTTVTDVAGIEAKIQKYDPDIVFVDGLYLVSDIVRNASKPHHEQLANVSRATRALAMAYTIPILATSQIHRMPGNVEKQVHSITLSDLAYSDALGQDADQVLVLIQTPEFRTDHKLLMKPLKMREGDLQDIWVRWNLDAPAEIGEQKQEVESDEEDDDMEIGDET